MWFDFEILIPELNAYLMRSYGKLCAKYSFHYYYRCVIWNYVILCWTEHGNWARLLNKVGKFAFWNRIWPYEHRSPDKCLNYILRGCVFSNLGFWIIIIISTVSRAIWKLENTMDLKWFIMFGLFEIFDNQLWSINQMKYNIHRMVEHWTSFLSFVENCVAFITMRIVNHLHLLTWSSVSCIIHSFTI